MAEGSNMNKVMKTKEGDDLFMGDWSGQTFVLVLRVIQSNGKPLPIRWVSQAEQCHKCYMKLLG